MTDVVVLPPEPKPGRDAKGKFAKGNKLRPAHQPNVGRPRKLDSRVMLEAIHDAFTPEEVTGLLRQARDIAVKNDDGGSETGVGLCDWQAGAAQYQGDD
jgi:hypothetical protein